MGDVHYFQRFSTKENVDTNNTLLLLSRIQATDPRLLRAVLAELLGEEEQPLRIGVQFSQQTKGDGSVPDGMLFQPSLRVLIETKRSPKFDGHQLKNHVKAFKDEATKILLLLSPSRVDVDVPTAAARGVKVVSRSFADIVAACRDAGAADNLSLAEVVTDFEAYCFDAGLMSDEVHRLMVVTVGTTSSDNLACRLYYCPVDRGFRKSAFLGLYWNKQVRAIGHVENLVCADLLDGKLKIKEGTGSVTKEQGAAIRRAISLALTHGWDISRGHRFFLTGGFATTAFRKTSPGGLFGKRYFNLRDELDLSPEAPLPNLAGLASELSTRTWQ